MSPAARRAKTAHLEDGARDGDALLLPPGELHPLLAHLGVVAVGEGAHKVVRIGLPSGLFHLVGGGGAVNVRVPSMVGM